MIWPDHRGNTFVAIEPPGHDAITLAQPVAPDGDELDPTLLDVCRRNAPAVKNCAPAISGDLIQQLLPALAQNPGLRKQSSLGFVIAACQHPGLKGWNNLLASHQRRDSTAPLQELFVPLACRIRVAYADVVSNRLDAR